MKKTLLLSAIIALGLSSCKKDRTCTCTTTYTSNTPATGGNPASSYSSTNVNTYKMEKVTKRGAESGLCASYSGTGTQNMTSTTTFSGTTYTSNSNGTTTQSTDCKLD